MLQRRLKALKHYRTRSMPTWGADLSGIDFEDIYYYLRASDKSAKSWEPGLRHFSQGRRAMDTRLLRTSILPSLQPRVTHYRERESLQRTRIL